MKSNFKTKIITINILIKLSLIGLYTWAIISPPALLAGKGMASRAPLFLASSILIPLYYSFKSKQFYTKIKSYPFLADSLVALPFLFDTLGNFLGFYNDYQATDDILHFINWLFLIPGITLLIFHNRKNLKDFLLIGSGISALKIVIWEIFEWFISDAGPLASKSKDTLSLSYGDTIGDLFLSTTGGIIGLIICLIILKKLKHGKKF